jgi:hypothetical protein
MPMISTECCRVIRKQSRSIYGQRKQQSLLNKPDVSAEGNVSLEC